MKNLAMQEFTPHFMTEREASTKNRAFKMNRVNKKYVLKKEWQ